MTGQTTADNQSGKAMLSRLRRTATDETPPMPEQALHFSPVQQMLFAAQKLHHGQAVGNVTKSWEISGALDPAAFERALQALVARHDAFRMKVTTVGGPARPVFSAHIEATLALSEVSGETRAERLAEIDARITEESLNALPLDGKRLWRVRLFKVDDTTHVLMFVLHHLICDDWSWRLLIRDLMALYGAAIEGNTPDLPPAGRFGAFLARTPPATQTKAVSDSPEIDWPTTAAEVAPHKTAVCGMVSARLDASSFNALRSVARIYNCTPFTFCISAYQFLLAAYCDQKRFGVAVAAADRQGTGEENAIGPFIREMEIGVDLSRHSTFASLLRGAGDTIRAVRAQEVDPMHSGRAAIGYYNAVRQKVDNSHLRVTARPSPQRAQSVALRLNLSPDEDGLGIEFEGQTRHFSQKSLDALTGCFTRILHQVIANPEIPLADIDLVSPDAARAQARRSIARAPLPACDGIAACFGPVAQKHADRIALETRNNRWSYDELDRETNALAHWLLAQGLSEGDRLAVAMPRGTAVFRTWLAALKAGLTVVPIDSDMPVSRMRYILRESNSDALIGVRAGQVLDGGDALRSLSFPTPGDIAGHPDTAPPLRSTGLDRDAFVMFTSGTTGNPKSIPVPHAGVIRLVTENSYFPVSPDDRMIQIASSGFDGSFFEVWGSWLNGATLVLSEKHIFAEGGLEAEFRTLAPTVSFMTTSLFNTLVDADPAILRCFRHLSIGGEAASARHCRDAMAANPSLSLSNVYGPTENAAFTTGFWISPDVRGNVPIGRPMSHNDAFVLSDDLRPVPDEFAGELLVGGLGLSRGYENRPDERAEKFIAFAAGTLGSAAGEMLRLYRTGDRARWNADGQIEFLGRRDTQFKLHGHRIEPSEIESALMEHPNIGRAAIVPQTRDGEALTTGIIAFYEPHSGDAPAETELRAFLESRLPRPILPTRYVQVAAIPLTANGKADTGALLRDHRADDDSSAGSAGSVDPITAIWREVLGRKDIPETANFFVLGGTSLSLVRMILDVEKAYSVDIDFASFAADPTLPRLRYMVAVSPAATETGMRHLRVLRDGDPALAPIVLMPMMNGQAAWAIDLLSELTVRNPVLALTFVAPQSNDIPPDFYSDLVDSLMDDLTASAPSQPLILAGFSFGGALAAHIAGHEKARALKITKLVNLDGTSPVSRLVPPPIVQDNPLAMFFAQFHAYPATVVRAECHLFRTLRSFPYASTDLGRDWSFFVEGPIREYEFDTHHGLLTEVPFAKHTAKTFAEIIAGTARPTRVRESGFDRARLAKLNRVKQLVQAEKPVAAANVLEAMFPDRGDIPDWIAVPLIHILQNTRRKARLAKMKPLWPRFSAPQIWAELAKRPFGPRRTMLENGYALSGSERSGALPLVDLYLKNGDAAEASAIIDALRSSERFQVEAGIAEALVAAQGGDLARAQERMQRALSAEDANMSHAVWCVLYFARRRAFAEAQAMVNSQRAKFADSMQNVQLTVQKMAAAAPTEHDRGNAA